MKSTFYLLLAALWLVVFGVQAQTPTVRVNVNLLPPYSTHLADYVDQPGRLLVTVTNLRATAIDVQFAASLSSDAGIRVFTKSGYQSSRPFTLDALQTRQLGQDELKDLFDANSLTYEGLSVADIARGGGLPEGTYTICVQALDYATRQPLSADAPGGCSRPVRLASLEAPYLIRPVPDEVARVNGPQNILFTWTRPAGAPPTTEYLFRLVEMSSNQRNPNDAFLSATVPVLYERTVTGAPSLLYSPAEPALILGRRYAFAVQAVDPVGNTLFRNNGRSEVQAFTYGTVPAVVSTTPVEPPRTPPVVVPDPTWYTRTITGHLQWGWRSSEETGAPLNSQPNRSVNVTGAALEALRDPSAGAAAANALRMALGQPAQPGQALAATTLSTTAGLSAVLSNTTAISGGGTSTSGTGPALAENGPGLQLPAVMGQARFPVANTNVRLVLDIMLTGPRVFEGLTFVRKSIVLGTGTTDGNGNFAITIVASASLGNLYYREENATFDVPELRVEVDDPHFYNEPGAYPVTPAGAVTYAGQNFTVGEVLCMAKSYRLVAKVITSEGQPATGVQVQVGRTPAWYGAAPYARAEGTLPLDGRPTLLTNPAGAPTTQQYGPDPASVPGAVLATVVASTTADPSAPLTRLLANVGGANDEYWVRISGNGCSPLTTTLSAWPSGSDYRAGVITLTTTYVLPLLPAQVRGRVRERPGGAPVANATVELWPTGVSKRVTKSYTIKSYAGGTATGTQEVSIAVTTRTDANGYFSIPFANSNLRAGAPLTLEVTSTPGLSVWREDNLVVAADGPGRVVMRDTIQLDRITFPVLGIVRAAAAIDSGGLRLATLRWASGGGTFLTDDRGRFLTTHPAGTDTLLISKLGYATRRVGVTVGGTGATTTTAVQLASILALLNARLQPVGKPPYLLPGLDLPLNASSLQAWTLKVRAAGTPFGQALDLGVLNMAPPTGSLRVAVTAGPGGPPLAGARVTLNGYNPARTETTDASGLARFNALSEGLQTVLVRGPAGTSYVLGQRDVWVVADGPATTATVALVAGGIVRGTVQRGTQPLAGAHVLVRGRPELAATTGPDGRYELLGVPLTVWALDATGPGATGQTRPATLVTAGQAITVDFTLKAFDGNLTATSLLGFPIELTSLRMVGADAVVSGYFVRLPNNATFTADNSPRLGFTNVTVQAGPDGNLRPKGQDYVVTDVTELDLHAFGYLPIRLRNPAGLRVALAGTDATQGQLMGTPEVLLSTYAPGLSWTNGSTMYLSTAAAAGATPPLTVAVLTASGTLANPPTRLQTTSTTGVSCTNLYGFAADIFPVGSTAGPDGLHLNGQVACPLVASQAPKVPLKELWLDSKAYIQRATLSLNTTFPLKAEVSGFSFALKTGELTEDGFRLGGILKVSPKNSAPSELTFSGLMVSHNATGANTTYGGTFALPADGIDVFNTAKFKPVANTLVAFGAVANKAGLLSIKGAATVALPLVGSKVQIKSFEVRSDNTFEAVIQADLTQQFLDGLATLAIQKVTFKATEGESIDVNGYVQLALPLVTASVGGIHFRRGTDKPVVSVDSIAVGVPIGAGELAGYVLYKQTPVDGQTATRTSLGGGLKVNVKGFLTLDGKFLYSTVPGSYREYTVSLYSRLPAGVPLLAGGVYLTGAGGGLTYRSDKNPGLTSLTIIGSIAFGTPTTRGRPVELDKVTLTVAQGPVISGSGGLKVIDQALGQGSLTLDFPNKLFSVKFNSTIKVVPGLDPTSASGVVVFSGNPDDEYWIVGFTAKARLAGLFDGSATMVMGGGVNVRTHPELAIYTGFVPRNYLSGNTLNGAHVKGYATIGRTRASAYSVDFWKVSGRVWYGASGNVLLNSNFSTGSFGIEMGCTWSGGAEVTIANSSIGGAEVSASGNLAGTYTSYDGWALNGTASALMRVWFGNCGSGCTNTLCTTSVDVGFFKTPVPSGGMGCLRPSLNVGYHSNTGAVDVGLNY